VVTADKFVRTGNLSAASRNDSRATDSVKPSSSTKCFPFHRRHQKLRRTFPLPIRFRWTRGHRFVRENPDPKLPLRFMLRVNATRAASICVFVIHARSSVWRPNSPKLIRKFREAVPLRLPRWVFRYFTRLRHQRHKKSSRLELAPGLAVAEAVQPAARAFPLVSYRSSISHRSFRKLCLLRQIRNRSASATCAAGFCFAIPFRA